MRKMLSAHNVCFSVEHEMAHDVGFFFEIYIKGHLLVNIQTAVFVTGRLYWAHCVYLLYACIIIMVLLNSMKKVGSLAK